MAHFGAVFEHRDRSVLEPIDRDLHQLTPRIAEVAEMDVVSRDDLSTRPVWPGSEVEEQPVERPVQATSERDVRGVEEAGLDTLPLVGMALHGGIEVAAVELPALDHGL